MKKIIQVLIIALVLISGFYLKAERTPEEKKLQKVLKSANQHFIYGEYFEAIPDYKTYLESVSDNPKVYYRLGLSYIKTHDKKEALQYIKKAHTLDTEVAEDIEFELGDAYHFGSNYKEAIFHYKKYLKKHENNEKLVKVIKRRIYECENGIEFTKNPRDIQIENLGKEINSEYDDYSPLISANENLLFFTSKRKGTTGGTKTLDGAYSEDIYTSNYINGKWEKAKNLSDFNTQLNDATVSLSPDAKKIITWREDGNGDLFSARIDSKGKWGSLKLFPEFISSKNSRETSAAISKDWLTLIFSSDRKGGYGGLDLYMSTRKHKNGEWGQPKNLGKEINTEYDDDAPYLDIDHTLYFSSKGHKGMGGFDIFKSNSVNKKDKWSSPENLELPINSPEDDIFYVIAGDGRYAYFNSVKDIGYGGEDIYRFQLYDLKKVEKEREEEEMKRKKLLQEITGKKERLKEIKVVVKDMKTNKVLDQSEIVIYDRSNKILANSTHKEEANTEHKVETNITDLSSLKIHAEHQGYLPNTHKVELEENEEGELQYVVTLQQIEKDAKLSLHEIHFSSNSSVLSPESFIEIDKLVKFMKEHPNVYARLEGHTDSMGSDEYNMKLSRSRSVSVKKYMLGKGIEDVKLKSVGFGETKPIADNNTPDGRQMNRRLEFIIDSH